jgi:hypothetical protein
MEGVPICQFTSDPVIHRGLSEVLGLGFASDQCDLTQ